MASFFLALIYVLTGLGLAFERHEDAAITLHPVAKLSTHACGARDSHPSLDAGRVCPACAQAQQRLGTPPVPAGPPGVMFVCTCLGLPSTDDLIYADRHPSVTRAPPMFL